MLWSWRGRVLKSGTRNVQYIVYVYYLYIYVWRNRNIMNVHLESQYEVRTTKKTDVFVARTSSKVF
jgi:hypothetical protein